MKKSKKLFLIPIVIISTGLITASTISSFSLLNIDPYGRNISFNGREYDPENPSNPPEQSSDWIELNIDQFIQLTEMQKYDADGSPFWVNPPNSNNTRGTDTGFYVPVQSIVSDRSDFRQLHIIQGSDSWTRQWGSPRAAIEYYATSNWSHGGLDAINNSQKTNVAGNYLNTNYAVKVPQFSSWRKDVTNRNDRKIGGRINTSMFRDSISGRTNPHQLSAGLFNSTSYKIATNSTYFAYTKEYGIKEQRGFGYDDNLYGYLISGYGGNNIYTNDNSSLSDIWQNTLYLGKKGGDGYIANTLSVSSQFAHERVKVEGHKLLDSDKINRYGIKVGNNYWLSTPFGDLPKHGEYNDKNYYSYFPEILSQYKGFNSLYLNAWNWWYFDNAYRSRTTQFQALWGYTSYYSDKVELFLVPVARTNIGSNVRPANYYQPIESNSPSYNELKQSFYPSQVIKNLNSFQNSINIQVSEWHPRYYLSKAWYKYNDDLGTLELRFRPGPYVDEWELAKQPLYRWSAWGNSQQDQRSAYVPYTFKNSTSSHDKYITLRGFKSNSTSWINQTISFTNAAKYVASTKITLDELRDDLWAQMTIDATYDPNLGWRSKEDKFIKNWDRIKGFDKSSILFKSYNEVNIREGYIKVNVALTKSIINGYHKDDEQLPTVLKFVGFHKIEQKTSVQNPWLFIGNGQNIDNFSNTPTEREKNVLRSMILENEKRYEFTNKSFFDNIDYRLLSANTSTNPSKPVLEVLDYTVNRLMGDITVLVRLNEAYDPNINTSNSIPQAGFTTKLKISGFSNNKTSAIINTNPTIAPLTEGQLYGVGSYYSGNDHVKGPTITTTNLLSNQPSTTISGYGASMLLSSYYNPKIGKYVNLYMDPETNELKVGTSENFSMSKKEIEFGSSLVDYRLRDAALPRYIQTDMKMIPLNDTNVSGFSDSYLVFPAGPTGLTGTNMTESPLKYMYIAEVSLGRVDIRPVINNPFKDWSCGILSASGIVLEKSQYDREYTLILKLYDYSEGGTSKTIAIKLRSSRADVEVINIDSKNQYLVIDNRQSDAELMKYMNFELSKSTSLPVINDADGSRQLYNDVNNPAGAMIFDSSKKQYSSAHTTVISQEKVEFAKVKFNQDYSNPTFEQSYFVNSSAGVVNGQDFSSEFIMPNMKASFISRSQRYLITNAEVKTTSTKYAGNKVAIIYDLILDKQYVINLNSSSTSSEHILLVPDTFDPLGNYAISLDASNSYVKSERIFTDSKNDATTELSIFDIYQKYNESFANKDEFSKWAIETFIYNPDKGINNLKYIPHDWVGKESLFEIVYDQVFFNFEKNEVYLMMKMNNYMSSSLEVNPNTLLFKISANKSQAIIANDVIPIKTAWSQVTTSSITKLINDMNEITDLDAFNTKVKEYFQITGNLLPSTKFIPGSLKISSLNNDTAEISIAVSNVLGFDNSGSIQMTNSKAFTVLVNIKSDKLLLPANIDIVKVWQGSGVTPSILPNYAAKLPGDFVDDITMSENKEKLISDIKEAILIKLKPSTSSGDIVFDLTKDDIILSDEWNYNNSSGKAWVDVSVPKYAGSNDVSNNNPYINTKVEFSGFKKVNPTVIEYVSSSINEDYRKAVLPSELQGFLDKSKYNIYYFLAIANGYRANNLKKSNYFWPYIINQDGDIVANNNYDSDQSGYENAVDFVNNNTTIRSKVISYNDAIGEAEVTIFISNGFTNEDNVNLQPNGAPLPDTTIVKNLVFTGLKTTNENASSTSVVSEIRADYSVADEIYHLVPSDLLKPQNHNLIIDQLKRTSALINYPGNDSGIKFVELDADNKQGILYASIHLDQIKSSTGDTVQAPPNLIFKTKIIGLPKVNGPTEVQINKNKLYDAGDKGLAELNDILFNSNGLIKPEAVSILNNWFTIKNLPNGAFDETKGRVVDVSVVDGTATLELSIPRYFTNNSTYAELEGLEIKVQLYTDKSTGHIGITEYQITKNGNEALGIETKIESYSFIDEKKVYDENRTKYLIIFAVSSSLFVLLLTATLCGYVINKKKN